MIAGALAAAPPAWHTAAPHASSCSSVSDAACCWICLDAGGGLERPCACPRASHPRCLARWQLQQAGRPEERACRFCGGAYADWRGALSSGAALPAAKLASSPAGCKQRPAAARGAEACSPTVHQVWEMLCCASDEDLCRFAPPPAAPAAAPAHSAAARGAAPRSLGSSYRRMALVEHAAAADGGAAAAPRGPLPRGRLVAYGSLDDSGSDGGASLFADSSDSDDSVSVVPLVGSLGSSFKSPPAPGRPAPRAQLFVPGFDGSDSDACAWLASDPRPPAAAAAAAAEACADELVGTFDVRPRAPRRAAAARLALLP